MLINIKHQTIFNEKAINQVAKNYNTLGYQIALIQLLKEVYPSGDFEDFSKYELHKLLNDTIFDNYKGEEILKYKLFQCYNTKTNIVGAFEIKVNNSRVDFLTINGFTTSYEIKSELDNLSKLSKQMSDYLLAFEYNYLVVDEVHHEKAKDILPTKFGLWCYKNGKYKKIRKAELNNDLDSETQLRLLTKKEIGSYFPDQDNTLNGVLGNYTNVEINQMFKKILKDRYKDRWRFLLNNQYSIFPIDMQFFFNTNIEPNHIYNI